jgi:porin
MGVADARFNAVGAYLGGAIVASQFLPGRPNDAVGIAVAHARTGGPFREQLAFDGGAPERAETAVELTWRAPLADWLSIVPSLQWVNSPGADRSLRNALVAGVRLEMSAGHDWPLLAQQAEPGPGVPAVAANHSAPSTQ